VRLLDANIRYPMSPMATLWFGQGKAPFGRQQLTSSGNLNMVDRTITDGRFSAGRHIGVALIGQNTSRTFEYGAGIYNGNGINATNTDMNYMYVGRAVWTPLGAYSLAESAHDYPEKPRVALGVAGLHNTDGEADVQMTVARLGVEAAFKVRGFNSTAEFYHERQNPATGAGMEANGWYVQAGYLFPGRRHELAARYAVISPASPVNSDMIEMGAGHSLYFNGHRAKLQTDLRTIRRRRHVRHAADHRSGAASTRTRRGTGSTTTPSARAAGSGRTSTGRWTSPPRRRRSTRSSTSARRAR
jgi:phosphate-selective porin OprO and OprP